MTLESKTDWQATASREVMVSRARMLQGIRAFFADRDVLEVETPVLSRAAITDPHLHSFASQFLGQVLYLQTSPEFFMKRLLAAGSGDIYQVCKVYRDDEQGTRHNPEFTLLEWYRLGFDQEQLMGEVEQLVYELFGQLEPPLSLPSADRVSYRQAFVELLAVDPIDADISQLQQRAQVQHIDIPIGMQLDDKDMWLDWLMTQCIAPAFAKDRLTFIYDYPASQAALARLSEADPRLAHRFELYYGELELANGFYELTDAAQQAARFAAENKTRQQLGLDIMPVDQHLLDAMAHGLPASSGVAIGLDRLLMVMLGKKHIEEVLSFSFDRV